MDRFTQPQAAAHHRRGRRQPAGLLPDVGQVAGRGRPGPGAWKGRVCLGATRVAADSSAFELAVPIPLWERKGGLTLTEVLGELRLAEGTFPCRRKHYTCVW
jgi:hypothetical protein